jgi:flagellar hook-length control protein FliK
MLLPAAEATAAAGNAPGAEAQPGGAFAALLTSLATTAEGETSGLELDPSVLPDGSDTDGEGEATNPFAALMAMTVPLVLQPNIQTVAVVAVSNEAGAPVGTVSGEASAVSTPGIAADESLAEPAAGALTPPTEAAGGAEPAGAAAQTTTPPTEASPSPAAATPGAIVEAAAAVTSHGAEAAHPADSAPPPESPPTEAASSATPTSTSVVRNVGNAETDNQDSLTGDGKSRADGPEPKASVRGLAHAASNSAVGELRASQQTAPTDAVAAPDAPQAPATADVPPQVEHVANTVIERVEAGGGEARIHLDPAGLGEVTIHVHTDGDAVRIDVRAERHEAAQLLRDHTQDLSSLLGERGLNLSDVNVGLGRGNAGQAWEQDARPQNRPATGEFAGILGFDEPVAVETHNRLRAAYNPDGAHVYRI